MIDALESEVGALKEKLNSSKELEAKLIELNSIIDSLNKAKAVAESVLTLRNRTN